MDSSKIMGRVTALILLGVVLYVAAQMLGKLSGDISAVLLLLTVISFLYWLYDKTCLKPQRVQQALDLEAQIRAGNEGVDPAQLEPIISREKNRVLTPPWWIEWTAGFFWVILFLFVVRSFIVEPYRIPSGSMMPTLEAGDFILVSKSAYGIRLPVLNIQIVEFRKPERGEVVVFESPAENIVMIKRIVGLPGDIVRYEDKRLTINGEEVFQVTDGRYLYPDSTYYSPQYKEQLGGIEYNILYGNMRDNIVYSQGFLRDRPFIEACEYSFDNFVCTVPEGYYFMMGDNRDNSLDSRYWGFVPERNIIGRAFFIWLNIKKFNRIGAFQ